MNVTVTVFLNVAGEFPGIDPALMSSRFLCGYQEGDPITPVFRYDIETSGGDYLSVCSGAYYLFNVGDEDGHEIALNYRARELRSLSVGDVLSIDCGHRTAFFACDAGGWVEIQSPTIVVFGVDVPGTHSDNSLRLPHVS